MGGQPLVGMGHPHQRGLPAVDAAAQRPASVGVGAVVDIAVAAEVALAAEGLDVDRHAVARAERRNLRAHLLDDAHHLVAHGDALDGARHAAVEDVQVAGADACQRDAYQGVAGCFEPGFRLFAELEASAFDIGTGFHGPACFHVYKDNHLRRKTERLEDVVHGCPWLSAPGGDRLAAVSNKKVHADVRFRTKMLHISQNFVLL